MQKYTIWTIDPDFKILDSTKSPLKVVCKKYFNFAPKAYFHEKKLKNHFYNFEKMRFSFFNSFLNRYLF